MTQILLIVFCLFTLPSFAEEAVHGVMMVVKGDIKVTSAADKKTEPAKVGRKVFSGDTITSGPESRAKIVMSDKNILNISPDSKLTIEKYTNGPNDKNVELKVEYGKIRASVEQKYDGEKSKFNVKTPSAVAGVRGTDFLTSYNSANKQSQVITFSGTVAVGKPGPGGTIVNPVFVQPGQMTTSSDGKPPEQPKAMPAEDLNKMKQESSAEAAPAKADSKNSDGKKEEQKEEKKEEKKEDKKEDKKEEKKDDKKDEKKKEDKKDSGDKKPDKAAGEPGEKSADKVAEKNADKAPDKTADKAPDKGPDKAPDKVAGDGNSGNSDKKPIAEGKKPAPGGGPDGDVGRAPAGAMPPSMVDSRDLGPDLSRNIDMGPQLNIPKNFSPTGPIAPLPIPNQFINDAIRNQKSNTTIIITK